MRRDNLERHMQQHEDGKFETDSFHGSINALDLMENVDFLEKLKFGIGDGNLQYYIYNWRSPQMSSKEVGLVLQ